MKLSNLFYLGALSALVLTGCKDNDDNSEWMTDGVVFTSHIEGMVSRASGSAWSDGDKVGIYMNAGGTDFENYEYTASADGALTAAGKTLKYPEEGTADFFAYYPYQTSISNKTYAVNVSDQSDPTKIDLLYATKTGISNGEAVNFAFSHQLSQIVINVSHDETIANLNGLKIQVKGMNTQASFALADGTLTSTDSKADFDMNVNAEGTTAEAIVIPTADLTGAELVFTLADGKSFGWDLTQSDVSSFDKGTKYTYNASLSMTNGQPSADMGNATIDDWTTKPGGDINVDFGEGTQTGGEVVVLDEPFADGPGNFTIEDKELGSLSYVWEHNTEYHYMKASAYTSSANAAESWLVSPEINIPSDATNVILTFNHLLGHISGSAAQDYFTLQVTENNGTSWSPVTIPNYPENTGSGNWTKEESSGNIDLSSYKGKTIKFAFIYKSTSSTAPTWEIMDVKVVANGGSGTVDPNPDPDPEPTPGEETVIFKETCGKENVGNTKYKINNYTGWDNNGILTFVDEFAGEYQNADVRATSTLDNNIWLPAYTETTEKPSGVKISGFDVTNYASLKLSYDIATNKIPGDQKDIKVRTDKGNVNIESKTFSANNTYQNITVSLPDGITYIEFVSDADNTEGYRLDNIMLTGIAK
ncbi:MAG TPA: fimbrillin family protein [Candidatus Phocaeicola excrementigallinarum]|nr:fimbrillin family protein [Candidatus Phocaeicola excrementigallinarum]